MYGTSRVVVGITDSAHSMTLLRKAATEARRCHSVLVPVLAWYPADDDRLPDSPERRAHRQMEDLVTDVFGPEEPVVVKAVVIRARSLGEAVAEVASRPGDVVFSMPTRLLLWHRLLGAPATRWASPRAAPRKRPGRPARPAEPGRGERPERNTPAAFH
ncbi:MULTISPECIES: universal stress protein [unclassified Streptomyces]|uniref:universal stress protein n=1 Tax=unclassified Streptomyces TaxID=2593676 RepID=UPI002E2A6DBC|nr:universal stress protein [Streptomyces sp. NBC_00223]